MIFFSSLTTTKGKVLRNWHESRGKLIEYVITVTCIQPARSELIVCPRWGFRFIAAIADLVDLCFVWRAFTCRTPYCSSSWEMGTAQLQMVFSWISNIMILMQYNPRKFAAGLLLLKETPKASCRDEPEPRIWRSYLRQNEIWYDIFEYQLTTVIYCDGVEMAPCKMIWDILGIFGMCTSRMWFSWCSSPRGSCFIDIISVSSCISTSLVETEA